MSSSQIAHYVKDRYQPSSLRVMEFEEAIGKGYTFVHQDGYWWYTQDLMKTFYESETKSLAQRILENEDAAQEALVGGFKEALQLAALIKQQLHELRAQAPYDTGYKFAEALEILAMG
ncbi:hypothetical protein RZS08_39545, partial [Arthrospira platensis SPKY1]|nr:hypothetical protein [Arthrospira platensis SPKY1]